MLRRVQFDYSKLKGRIKEVFGTQAKFADAIGLSDVSVSNKLNNLVDWGQEDMVNSMEVLMLTITDIGLYFFTEMVENNSTT